MSGLGTSTQKSTQSSWNMYPEWTQQAQQDTYQTGTGMLENFLRNPQYAVAGFNPDQLKGFDLARDSMQRVYNTPTGTAPANPGLTAYTIDSPAMMTAASVDTSMNPFIRNVVDTTRSTMQRDWQDKDAALAASGAASAVRGSGAALARGQLARGAQENIGNIVAQLEAQGYDKSKAMELANAQMEQQARSTNTANDQQRMLANASAVNAMRTTGADYGLKAAQVNDALRTSQLGREMTTLQQILNGGGQQQQLQQQALNVPRTMLQMLMGLTPDEVNSMQFGQGKTTSTASPMSTISSAVSALSGIKGLFGGK